MYQSYNKVMLLRRIASLLGVTLPAGKDVLILKQIVRELDGVADGGDNEVTLWRKIVRLLDGQPHMGDHLWNLIFKAAQLSDAGPVIGDKEWDLLVKIIRAGGFIREWDELAEAHIARVEADGGVVYDADMVTLVYKHAVQNGYYEDVAFLGTANTGVKTQLNSGDGRFITKVYDMGPAQNDATQGTEAEMPRLSRATNDGNVLKWNRDFTDAAYTKSGAVADDATTLREDGTTGEHIVYQSAIPISPIQTHKEIARVRRGVGTRNVRVTIFSSTATANFVQADIDLGDGSTLATAAGGNGSGQAVTVTADGSDWKIELSGKPSTAGTSLRVQIQLLDGSTASYAGDDTSTLVVTNQYCYPEAWDDAEIDTEAAREFGNGGLPVGMRTVLMSPNTSIGSSAWAVGLNLPAFSSIHFLKWVLGTNGHEFFSDGKNLSASLGLRMGSRAFYRALANVGESQTNTTAVLTTNEPGNWNVIGGRASQLGELSSAIFKNGILEDEDVVAESGATLRDGISPFLLRDKSMYTHHAALLYFENRIADPLQTTIADFLNSIYT